MAVNGSKANKTTCSCLQKTQDCGSHHSHMLVPFFPSYSADLACHQWQVGGILVGVGRSCYAERSLVKIFSFGPPKESLGLVFKSPVVCQQLRSVPIWPFAAVWEPRDIWKQILLRISAIGTNLWACLEFFSLFKE